MTNSLNLETITLAHGAHLDRSNGLCIMEVVAWLANEPHSDSPACICPVLGAFLRSWSDALDDKDRQMLKPFISRLVGTNDGHSEERSWMAMDWIIRDYLPAWLQLIHLDSDVDALKSLTPISGPQTLSNAVGLLPGIGNRSAAAWAAAWDAARAATWAAVWAAARAALKPTVVALQTSALVLLDRMIDCGKEAR